MEKILQAIDAINPDEKRRQVFRLPFAFQLSALVLYLLPVEEDLTLYVR